MIKSIMSRKTKKEVCALIIGKTIGDMQRIVKQYDYKFNVDKYDGVISDIPKTNKYKTIHIEIEKDIVTKAV